MSFVKRRDRVSEWWSRSTGRQRPNLNIRHSDTGTEVQPASPGQQQQQQFHSTGNARPSAQSTAISASSCDASSVAQVPASPPPPYQDPPCSAPSSSPPSSPLVVPPSSVSVPTPPRLDILDKALAHLNVAEREKIISYLEPNNSNIASAVDKVCLAARKRKEECETHRAWTIRYHGETVSLRDKADKVLVLFDRIKQIGDILVNVDPLHAGIPWAGIRLMLEVATADKQQMTFLLDGFEVAVYMINRLKAYLEYLADLPQNPATTNFGAAVVKFYAFVLQFLARSIIIYEKHPAMRFLQAFAEIGQGNDFRIECAEHERRTEAEAAICERFMSQMDRHQGKRLYDDFRAALGEIQAIRDISGSVDRLHEKIDLLELQPVVGAAFDSYAAEETAICIYWLKGMAGTGKSTIARTVADMLHKKQSLGASFFFKRGEANRSSSRKLFPTLAYQLAARLPPLGKEIAKSLEANRGVCDKILREQFDKLMLDPLNATLVRRSAQLTWVIVLDALDECASDRDIRTLIKLLAELKTVSSYHLRIFVTSRPELPIRLGFQTISGAYHHDVVL
ncbi:hypothetical protein LTR86_006566 [Recurvomyces mirabilis]|nr:hypothetical protein LTR86_006566 [Recurvomyces mirabilis]